MLVSVRLIFLSSDTGITGPFTGKKRDPGIRVFPRDRVFKTLTTLYSRSRRVMSCRVKRVTNRISDESSFLLLIPEVTFVRGWKS